MAMLEIRACERCGDPIMQPVTQARAINMCECCGHVTPPESVTRFQWTSVLQTIVSELLDEEGQRKLYLDPKTYINEKLNQLMIESGRTQVVIDMSTDPITLRGGDKQ
ncbi:MAG TPA: hypothetical protein VIU93_14055 [Gallionellaceae bacterium]